MVFICARHLRCYIFGLHLLSYISYVAICSVAMEIYLVFVCVAYQVRWLFMLSVVGLLINLFFFVL